MQDIAERAERNKLMDHSISVENEKLRNVQDKLADKQQEFNKFKSNYNK